MRLKRADCAGPGITRRRAGRGFIYLDQSGRRITDETLLERIRSLVIPPAWRDVWICPRENGHIQATGFDEAGRKQYLYHEKWTSRRAAEKFDAMLRFSSALPRLRRAVDRDLKSAVPDREPVLACAVRLLDLGHFRIGSEQYAEENSTFGVATILRRQVTLPAGSDEIVFDYPAKGALDRRVSIRDRAVRTIAEPLMRRRSGPDDFLVYRSGRRWADVRSTDINEYIRDGAGGPFSAKDFRTWHGTVIAARALAGAGEVPSSRRGRERVIRAAVDEVAEALGNTPAVARDSYIDPRLFDRYRDGDVAALKPGAGRPSRTGLSAAERTVRSFLDG